MKPLFSYMCVQCFQCYAALKQIKNSFFYIFYSVAFRIFFLALLSLDKTMDGNKITVATYVWHKFLNNKINIHMYIKSGIHHVIP